MDWLHNENTFLTYYSIPSKNFVDEANHRNVERDPFPSRSSTPRRILLGSFVVDPPFFDNVVC